MIEIGLGGLIILGVVALLAGAGGLLPGHTAFDPLPLLGYGGVAFLIAAGVLLVAAGLARRAIARNPDRRRELRTARLSVTGLLLVALLAVGIPLAHEPFNLIVIAGFPLGYYLAAQGLLIGLVALAFLWAARQSRIDAAGDVDA